MSQALEYLQDCLQSKPKTDFFLFIDDIRNFLFYWIDYWKLNDDLQYGNCCIEIGVCFYDTGQTFDAIDYFEKVRNQAKQCKTNIYLFLVLKSNFWILLVKNDSLSGRALMNLGNCYLRINEHKKALEFYEKSLELLRRSSKFQFYFYFFADEYKFHILLFLKKK